MTAESPTAAPVTAAMVTPPNARDFLLDDLQVASFIKSGYLILNPDLPEALHPQIDRQLSDLPNNPGDGILDAVPELYQVINHPQVQGTLISLLGTDFALNNHRHWHCSRVGMKGQSWHQDSRNVRHHQIRTVLGFYYPQEVTAELGPTVILPGTHFRNCPTDRMGGPLTYRDQVLLKVKAGTVVIAHYDLWHAGTANQGPRDRHMIKLLFTRKSEPTAPSWRHDPTMLPKVHAKFSETIIRCSQTDHYKEIGLRREMWQHLIGQPLKPA
jgi:hypothetical protein